VYSEEDWNSLEDADHDEACQKSRAAEKSYFAAKTAAEKEAWRIVQTTNQQLPTRSLSLVSINPSVILGSLLSNPTLESLNTSMQLLPGLFFGGDSGGTGLVDVEDVAEALLRAMLYPQAQGRYICNGNSLHYGEISAKLAKLYPDKCFAEEVEDASAIAVFKVEKIKKDLNLNFTEIDVTLKKSVDSLIEKNCFPL